MTPAAERQRRSRAHRKGDHSLCDPGRCDGASGVASAVTLPVPRPVTPVREGPAEQADGPVTRTAGGIEAAAVAFVASLGFTETDPRYLLGQLVLKLAVRIDETGALPAAVREFRVLLAQLAEVPDQPAGPVDTNRAQRAARRIDGLLARAS